MSAEHSMSERLAEIARLMRSPLAQSFGESSEDGREGRSKLGALMREFPAIEATTLVDALALVSITGEIYAALLRHSQNDEVVQDAVPLVACALMKLRGCLADLAGMDPTTFGLSPEEGPQRLH